MVTSSGQPLNPDELWRQFLADVRKARDELGNPDPIWYRGHSDSTYSLVPSLFRNADWPSKEQQAFNAFQRTASRLFEKRGNDWEVLFDMQHYGLPTRLLDWSEALGVAIAFIVYTPAVTVKDAALFILDPRALNEYTGPNNNEIRVLPAEDQLNYKNLYWHGQPISPPFPIAVYPPLQSARLFAQRGTFTVHGHKRDGLEILCADVARKIVLPAAALPAAREFLEHANLDEYTIYPDIVGMARHLRRTIFKAMA